MVEEDKKKEVKETSGPEAPKEEPSEPPEEEAKPKKPEAKLEGKPEPEKVEEKPKEEPKQEPEKAKPEPKKPEAKPEVKPKEEPKQEPEKPEKKTEPAKEPEKPEEKPEPEMVEEKPKEEPKQETEKPEAKPKEEPKKPEAEPAEKDTKPKGPKKVVGIAPDKLLLFDKYDLSDVVVKDAGLARYINLNPIMVPHTGAKHANRPFANSKVNIVERLVNNMMRTEDFTGKKTKTYKVVMRTFDIIEAKTKTHPVQVLIEAIENATPREEVTRLRYGGVSIPRAVDVSSSRRLDTALRYICKGAIAASYKNTKSIETCLANEIMLAAKGDMNSSAVSKKEEIERIAASAR